MEDVVIVVLLFGVIFVVGIFAFYLLKTYLFPKKINELEAMLKQGHVQPAIKKLQKMLEENSRDPYIHFLLGRAYEQMKDNLSAVMEYKQALKYLEIEVVNQKLREETVRRRLGRLYLSLKNNEEAKKEFLILTKLNPDNADNFYQVGLLFEKSAMFNKALPYFQNTVKIDENHSDAHYRIGFIYFYLSNLADAKKSLTEAIRLTPNNYAAHYYLGMCFKNENNYEDAMKEFSLAARDEAFRAKAYLGKGLCFLELQDTGKAHKEFTNALEIAPQNSELELSSRYYLALAAEKNRDFSGAIAHWERITDVNPKYRDVPDKLKTYEDFRTDDSVKDFLIAPTGKFENTCKQLAKQMNLAVEDMHVESDSEIHMVCSSTQIQTRSGKKNTIIVFVFRSANPVTEKSVRQLYDTMRSFGSGHGMCISTGDFTSQAEEFAQSRPLDLIAKRDTTKLLRAIV